MAEYTTENRSQNCPCAGRRFLIRHQQPEHQAHSRRSPISTESHHEIGLQTGQHNDARVNLAIALTAARYGAAIANYTEVVHLLKRADPQTGKERVCGAHCRDGITGQEFDVRAKCVINATGPFTDALWKMDDQKNPDICQPSAGVHIVIPGYYRTICAPLVEARGAAAGIETS
ncbi:glycerol-3-phosphate dehydrogenase, mitochondrial-like [Epinephelus fuscoguttatus]|uniref:glycerol-3-phosphate dehydrogenase, mitochondrial-like n=1 Tax=Epinephelus fuscoguttatus TaxID=293821 RepID=UPI0020D1AE76|nr:glycerol-3-phosphate dehydrogenase, mitochondrial-like [Epinephelus fuscoguttatus]